MIFSESSDEGVSLSAIEIFNYFVRGKGKYKDYKCSGDLKEISFKKQPANIIYKIDLSSKKSKITFYNNRVSHLIPFSDLLEVLSVGYLVFEQNWYPINVESTKEISCFVKMINSEAEIETHEALRLATDSSASFLLREETRNILSVFEDEEEFLTNQPNDKFIRDLYPYQKRGLSWLKFCLTNKIGSILADDMGLGKTAQIIALISWALEKNTLKKILIVVPSTLLENWRREFEFFCPSVIPHIHHGSLRVGIASEFDNFNVIVTSYSLVINDFYILNDVAWDLTVLDEASLIKNPESERTKKIKDLNSRVRIAMTGTPVENSLMDLWSVADYAFPGFLGEKESFKEKFIGRSISDSFDRDLSSINEQVSMIMLRRMKIDLLENLPDKIDIHQALIMSDSERIEYERIRNQILANGTSNRENSFQMIGVLRQFTTHPFLSLDNEIDEEKIRLLPNVSTKFERTIEILQEIKNKGEKVLIFTGYIKMIDLLKEYIALKFKAEVFTIDGRVETNERQERIDLFSTTVGFSVMVLNPTTAAMGLNITAANHVIHYTRQWNPAIEVQASARAYRNGQKLGVNIYYLYYANTIEQVMDQRLRQKEALSGEVISVVEHSGNELDEMLNYLIEN